MRQYTSDQDDSEQKRTEGVEQLDVRLPQLGEVEVLFDPARLGPELPQRSRLLLLERLLRTKGKGRGEGRSRKESVSLDPGVLRQGARTCEKENARRLETIQSMEDSVVGREAEIFRTQQEIESGIKVRLSDDGRPTSPESGGRAAVGRHAKQDARDEERDAPWFLKGSR